MSHILQSCNHPKIWFVLMYFVILLTLNVYQNVTIILITEKNTYRY